MKTPKSRKDPKEALLDAFIELIGSMGAHQVTLQKAAKKAKVPFSTAHYYYGGDWNRIFEDAVQKVLKKAQEFISAYIQNESTPASNPIELYIDGTFAWAMEYRSHAQLWLFNYYSASINPRIASYQDESIQHARQRVMNLCFEARGRGYYPDLTVTKDVAESVHTIVFGTTIMGIMQNADQKKTSQIRKEAHRMISQLLDRRAET